LKRYHSGGYTTLPFRPSSYNNELDKWTKETTLQCNGEWIVGTKKMNVRDLLTL